jgi:DNA helicase HerA-like ATPase
MVIGYGTASNRLAEHDNNEVTMSGAGALRDPMQTSAVSGEALGHVHSVNGAKVSVGLVKAGPGSLHGAGITVGKFVKIQITKALLVGVITDVTSQTSQYAKEQGCVGTAHVDLMGEIDGHGPGPGRFRRGVTDYPTIGDPVAALTSAEMRIIFDSPGPRSIKIGHLQQDSSIGVSVDLDEMLSKHFAVLGTTGVGKSSAVALLLQQVLRARPDLRIMLLDVHNEYARCFGDRAYVVSPTNLRLPFWLFSFEELVDVFFGGRPVVEEEVEILSEVIPLAKVAYTQYRATAERLAIKKADPKAVGYTVDTPVPYRLQDLLMMIDERMGKLENRSSRMIYHRLITRIETVSNDSRYAFLFENANVGGDTMAEVIGALFRLPADGKPVTVMQLAGIPAEVVDSVVSVLCRMAFDFGLWSDGAIPMLFVCEEAHRYASVDRTIGFGPTRRAIARIAKEGRKYGVFLGLVTQRPAELDPKIISQCSTLFAMRLSNDRDQALLRSAVSDTAGDLFSFVPSLGTREALAFGVGVPLPSRLTFSELPPEALPRSEAFADEPISPAGGFDLTFIASVVERWRGSTVSQKVNQEEAPRDVRPVGPDVVPMQPAPAITPEARPEPSRLSLLKKPLGNQPDPIAALRQSITQPKR